MCRQCHADLDRDAGVGDVGRRAVADAVGADFGHAGAIEDASPCLVVGVGAEWLVVIEDGRTDVGRFAVPRRVRQQPAGFLAQRLGHIARLAVRPDDPAVGQVEPIPLQQQDL
ncbi:hypothetical protein D3C81_1548880 [compost metagenome]